MLDMFTIMGWSTFILLFICFMFSVFAIVKYGKLLYCILAKKVCIKDECFLKKFVVFIAFFVGVTGLISLSWFCYSNWLMLKIMFLELLRSY